ncbi:Asp-tRNA(Asn)/Glu-tRNA(Gln) amidotransferase subunit GatA [Rickettsiella endosymbiont of Dermanyssus gallinae]|uniref:Asp-tRNA(Asn)/Glu-tRNA(Gln) amidotransferase subunit GatA n=1 Tax=Rickettsiella endosymbiont of Dermanyssus gallinae TaxID=2856608 RepID=UPI001C52DA4D|nr:Asp-tRNA(Asn)/Glu-tRNA(Gln) amidotransferase subunit GatA [Rickettsiella endosymbiont of Dermanyssus gallinae]
MHTATLTELSIALKNKKISSRELTEHFLARIKKYDPQINSFITVTAEQALQQADRADEHYNKGIAGPLTGIPIAHKDIFCTDGIKTSCASKMLDNFIAPYDASLVTTLKQAGTVLLGKTNMDEFAMGSSNETSFYGCVKNPWDLTRVPGGSSGGSSAAVAARLTPAATGTDTGGSIRQPAALCNLTGLKPTYGRVSRYGLVAFASSLDQAGPMTQTAEDAALLMNAMAGFDKKDSTSMNEPVPDYTQSLNDSLEGLKIGLPKEYFSADLDPKIASCIEKAIKHYESLGASIHAVSLPNCHLVVPLYYIIASAECSSNLARYDGIRYGYRCSNPKDLRDLYERTRAEGFGDEVKRRILMGTYVLSAGYYDAYYIKAQKIRALMIQDFEQAFKQVDILIGPTTPSTAFKLGEKTKDPVSMYLSDIYTIAVNLAGLPAISIPAGFSDGLPVGMQLISPAFTEAKLLNVAHRYQQITDWHKELPENFK